jgi:hypothetical protein
VSLQRSTTPSSLQVHALDALALANPARELTGQPRLDLLPRHARAQHRQRMAQIDHLVDAASEEIGGVAHRKTPRKPQQNSRNLGEMLSENCLKVVYDQ